MDKNVCLKINDRDIPLNRFVKDVFANVVKGLVDSLDKIPGSKNKIEIIVEEEEDS